MYGKVGVFLVAALAITVGCAQIIGIEDLPPLLVCGNGIVERAIGEVCDDGNAEDEDVCSADCTVSFVCGNGVVDVEAGEICDDGNFIDGDGCSGDCLLATTCGNGYVDEVQGEACDGQGNTATCDADCTLSACGDFFLNPAAGEECDDGNREGGDGCDTNCQLA